MSGHCHVTPNGGETGLISEPADASVFYIGKVETLIGSCTITRSDGVPVQTAAGDPLFQGDIIETAAGGRVGIRFIDGTAFNLSDSARMLLKGFGGDAMSAPLDVTRGTFSFVAGEMAKSGRLSIETPFGRIRPRGHAGGIGMLSLVSLFFTAFNEAHGATSNVAFLDDGAITAKDLGQFGIVELTVHATATSPEKHILLDDPGETIVLRRVGSSISEDHVTNSITRMVQLQSAQQDALHTFSLGLQQGPTNTGASGSSTDPTFDLPTTPINFFTPPPGNGAPPPTVLALGSGPGGSQNSSFEFIPPPPPPQPPPIQPPAPALVVERLNDTGDPATDTSIGTLSSPGITAGTPTFVWSGGPLTPGDQSNLAAVSSLTFTGPGPNDFTYHIPDLVVDFLAAGETLTVTYNVTVAGGDTQQAIITVFGAEDAPNLAADVPVPHTITELPNTRNNSTLDKTELGTLHFSDVDLNDVHTVSSSLVSATLPGGGALPTGLSTVLANALSFTLHDSTHAIVGSVDFTFGAADKNFDFLAAGEMLTVTYDVTVADNFGATSTKQVIVTITGTEDAPVIGAATLTGAVTEDAHVPTETASGTIAFSDVDLTDTHLVSAIFKGTDYSSQLGSLSAVKTTDTTGTGTGGLITWTFTASDSALNQLAAGQTVHETYTVTLDDQHGGVITRDVVVTITGTEGAPVIGAATLTGAVTEDAHVPTETASGTIAFSDVDLTDTHLVSAIFKGTDYSSQLGSLSAVKTTDTTGTGTGGLITWTFTASDSALNQLAAGQTVHETYTVTLDDQHGGVITRDVVVTITGTEGAPVIGAATLTGAVTEDAHVPTETASGTIAFSDVDLTDTHLVSAIFKGTDYSSQLGSLSAVKTTDTTGTGTGGLITWTFTASDSALNQLAAGQTVHETYTVTLDDQHGGVITRDVVVTITGTEDAPVIGAATLTGAVTEDAHVPTETASGTIAFSDVDLTDTHLVSAIFKGTDYSSQLGSLSAVKTTDTTGTGTGGLITWTFTASDSALNQLAAGQTVHETYTVTLDDQHGGVITRDVVVTITGTEGAPVIGAATLTGAVTEDAHVPTETASGTIAFSDVDLTDTHLVSAIFKGTDYSSQLGSLSAVKTTDTTGTGTGGLITWTFTASDSALNQLAAGQTVHETYTVTLDDQHGGVITRDVVVTITGTEDAPVIGAATLTGAVTEDAHVPTETASGTIAFSDVDLTDTHLVSAIFKGTDYSSQLGSLSAVKTTDTTGTGTGGLITWTFTASDSALNQLAAGQTVHETYTVTLDDQHGGVITRDVVVTITGTEGAPVIGAATLTGAVTEDAHVPTETASGTIAFSDVDLTDTHLVSAIFKGTDYSSQLGSLSAVKTTDTTGTGTGGLITWTFTASDSALNQLAAGQTVHETYTVTLDDQHGGVITRDVVVTITGTEDAPVIGAATLTGAVTEDAHVPTETASGTIAFSDVDLTDTHLVSAIFKGTDYSSQLGSLSAVKTTDTTGTGTGGLITWTFTASDSALNQLAAGQTVHETYTVTLDDQHGGVITRDVVVTITGTEDAPVIGAATLTGAVTEDAHVPTETASGTIAFSDVDLTDTHLVSAIFKGTDYSSQLGSLSAVKTTDTTGTGTGGLITWTFTASDSALNQLAAGQTVHETYTVTLDDQHGGVITRDVVVTITGTEGAPVIGAATLTGAVTEDAHVPTETASGTIAFSDVDLTDTHLVSAIFKGTDYSSQLGSLSAVKTTDTTGTGTGGLITWTFTASDSALNQLAAGQTVHETYTVTLDDQHGGVITRDVVVTITGTEDAPVIGAATLTGAVTEDAHVPTETASGTIAFSDVDLTDTHLVSAIFKGTDYSSQLGSLSAVKTTDTTGTGTGGLITWTFTASDSALNQLAAGQTVHETYTVTLDDQHGGVITRDVVVTITGTEDAPVIGAATLTGAVTEDAHVPTETASGTIAFSDVDLTDTHLVSAIFKGTDYSSQLGSLSAVKTTDTTGTGTGGLITWTFTASDSALNQLAAGQTVHETYTVTLDDQHGGVITRDVVVTITGTEGAPVIGAATLTGAVTEDAHVPTETASGTIAFSDVDLTDTHLVSAIFKGTDYSSQLGSLSAVKTTDTTGTGTGGLITWTFTASDSALNQLAAGQTVHETYTVTLDDQHGGVITRDVVVTITGTEDAPKINSVDSASVSEEGLPGGIPDTTGAPDTTNSVTANGDVKATDPDNGAVLTYTFGNPTNPLTSDGTTVTWTGDGTNTLTGKIDAGTPSEKDIITVTINSFGHYTVTLEGPVDQLNKTAEDATKLEVPVNVSDGLLTTQATLPINIEDDSPVALPVSTAVAIGEGVPKLNIVIVLDVSGSMAGSSITLAKAALDNLLTSTDVNINQVMAVSFSTNAGINLAGNNPWTDAADAKAYIDALTTGGNTNYIAALNEVMNNWGGGPTAADQTLVYFVTDGAPTAGEGAQSLTNTWQQFLTANHVNVSYAIGINTTVSDQDLAPIAWTPSNPDFPPIVINSASGLDATLQSTIPPPVTHNVVTDGGAGFGLGADGGYIKSIVIDNDTYTFDNAGHITKDGGQPVAGSSIIVPTALGGVFTFYFATANGHNAGDWTYVAPKSAVGNTAEAESFVYTLIDNDGDTSSAAIHIDIHVSPTVSNLQITEGSISFNIADPDSTSFTLTSPFAAAFGNPALHLAGNSITPVAQASAISGTLQVTDGNTNAVNLIGLYLGTNGDNTGVTAALDSSPNAMYGFGGNDNLTGGGGADFIFGGAGNDTITGGAGADTMTGGAGADRFVIASGDSPGTSSASGGNNGTLTGYDVITDWGAGGTADLLDLPSTTVVGNTTHNNATPSALMIGGVSINSYKVTGGIITFDDATSYSTALTLSSIGNVAAAVDFIHRNDFATNNGAAMAFVANIGGTSHSYVFEQVGNTASATNDILVDLAGVNLSSLSSSNLAPAGVAGEAIDLGLKNPTDYAGTISVSITGVPSGWVLNEGVSDGTGTWTVQTGDVSTLSATAPAAYAGAISLHMSQTWTGSTGGTGLAMISNNVEAYAPGNPIFAISGDDQLTGSSGADLMVFAQPIGTDVVHNFDVAQDVVDLIGFSGFNTFADVQANLANDANGQAVLALGDGQSITFSGVDSGSLTAADFVFDQEPVSNNAASMVISDGAILPLSGIINNSGTIALDSAGTATTLELVQHGITLQGGGTLTLSDSGTNAISGTSPDVLFTNADNTISGAGHLGEGQMTLVNDGTIIASGNNALVIDTGTNAVVNSGTLEATGSGGLFIHGDVANDGLLWANNGNITINGNVSGSGLAVIDGTAFIELGGAFSQNILFDGDAAGALKIDHAADFSGVLSGLDGNDILDLADISAGSVTFTYAANQAGTGGTLTVTDSTNTANIGLTGKYDAAGFHATTDPNTGTLIEYSLNDESNPAGTGADTIISSGSGATLTGTADNDTFVFKSVMDSQAGAGHFDTITNFTHNADHIDLTTIAGATAVQGAVATANTVEANSISWFVDSAHKETVLYVNTTATANHVDMEIHLAGTNINLGGSDILHHT